MVWYDLYVRDIIVNFIGKEWYVYFVNGSILMFELYFMEGDIVEIWVYNELKIEIFIYWYGIILLNE